VFYRAVSVGNVKCEDLPDFDGIHIGSPSSFIHIKSGAKPDVYSDPGFELMIFDDTTDPATKKSILAPGKDNTPNPDWEDEWYEFGFEQNVTRMQMRLFDIDDFSQNDDFETFNIPLESKSFKYNLLNGGSCEMDVEVLPCDETISPGLC
jgi:hypothetical protein